MGRTGDEDDHAEHRSSAAPAAAARGQDTIDLRIAGEYLEIVDAATAKFEEAEAEERFGRRKLGDKVDAGARHHGLHALPKSRLADSQLRQKSMVVVEVNKLLVRPGPRARLAPLTT